MTNEYKLQAILKSIAKIEAIPSNSFCSGISNNSRGQYCFAGHYTKSHNYQEVNVILNITRNTIGESMMTINDGQCLEYQQSTEKERILAALNHIKKKLELIIYPPVDGLINNTIKTYEYAQINN